MKRTIWTALLLTIAGCFSIGISLTGKAAERQRFDHIKSRGIINYDDRVIIDAGDFKYLADEIDRLENAYKGETVLALNRIGTYFTAGGIATIDAAASAIDQNNADTLSYDAIRTAIEESQSVAGISTVPAVDTTGEAVYDKETGQPLFYTAAAAGNISAGGAAWVNGRLLLGNGADNQKHYQDGYQDGYDNGRQEINDQITEEGLFKPVILTGTAPAAKNGAYAIASVIIPTNLDIWCAGITNTSGCVAYFASTNSTHVYEVKSDINYNRNTGVVELAVNLGHDIHLGSHPQISYKIMYLPTVEMHQHDDSCYSECTVTRVTGQPYSYQAGHPEVTFYKQSRIENHSGCFVKKVDLSTIQTAPIANPNQAGTVTYTHKSNFPTCGQ